MNCYFCKEPLTSDDYKEDRIEKTKHFVAHSTCISKAIVDDAVKFAQEQQNRRDEK